MIGQIPATRHPLNRPVGTRRAILITLLVVLGALVGSLFPPRGATLSSVKQPVASADLRPVPPALGQAAQAGQAPPATLYTLPPELAGKSEVVAARTLDSATFDLRDGSYALFQGSEPLHYQ